MGALLRLSMCVAAVAAPASPGPWGVVVHTPRHTRALRALGVQWERIDVPWPQVAANGALDWKPIDALLDEPFGLGMHVIAILRLGALPTPPPGIAAAAEAARRAGALAQHLARRGVVWELGNEPDGWPRENPAREPEAYAQLARTIAEGIRKADPAAHVAALSVAWMDRAFILRALDAGLLKDGTIDTVSYHGYDRPQLAAESGIAEDVAWLRAALARHAPAGLHVDIIDSERGYALVPPGAPKIWSDWRNEVHSESEQAAYLARHYLESIHAGVAVVVWYKDMFGERGFSLFYGDEHDPRGLRPMGRVYQNLAHLLPDAPAALHNDRYDIALANDLPQTCDPNTLLVVRSFLRRTPTGERLIVALWNPVEAADGEVLAERHRAGESYLETWRTARPADQVELDVKLEIFGVTPARLVGGVDRGSARE